jgi:hypothetical protein
MGRREAHCYFEKFEECLALDKAIFLTLAVPVHPKFPPPSDYFC